MKKKLNCLRLNVALLTFDEVDKRIKETISHLGEDFVTITPIEFVNNSEGAAVPNTYLVIFWE